MPQDDYEDDLSTKLKMHTITSNTIGNENEENSEPQVIGEDEEYNLAQDPILQQLPEFEYDKLLPEQYIKFTDSDIPTLLNYIFDLRSQTTYQHNTKLPAAIVFQLVRYSALKVESTELTDFCLIVLQQDCEQLQIPSQGHLTWQSKMTVNLPTPWVQVI